MPMEAEARFDAMPVLLLAPEDRVAVTAGRLEAALAGEGNVFRPDLELVETKRKDRAGTHREKRATYEGEMLAFPDCIPKLRQWIKEYDIKLVVIDPIAAFLSERTNSNNDASVRRALEPLSLLLGSTGCAAILVRHLNKNTGQAAKFRGGGSVAFGAVSRIQLLAGELTGRPGFGIGQIKNNHLARKPDEVMTYTIEDSDIVADDEGNMVPRILWGENIRMGLPELAGEKKHGPQATAQPDIEEVLKELYDAQDTWPSKEVIARLKEEGVSTDRKTVTKVREALGIRSAPVYKPGGGLDYWNWTTVPEKHGPGRRRRG